MMNFIIEQKDGTTLLLHIQPGASKSEIAGIHGDRLKIRLKAPPLEGKANGELIKLLSTLLDVPKRNIEIIRGLSSRRKSVKIIGITRDQLIEQLKIK